MCLSPYWLIRSLCSADADLNPCRYALIATATDYDSWRPHSASVTTTEVFKTLKQNADTSRHVAAAILEDLAKETSLLEEEVGSMKFSIMPRSGNLKDSDLQKLGFVLPEYFN